MTVTDKDPIGRNDHVDTITISLGEELRADSQFGPSTTHSGSCGRASITVSVNITSLCPPNMYGPQCDQECVERAEQNTCNYLGQQQCLGNYVLPNCDECTVGFQAPGCITCAPDYYPAGICTTFCRPRNDSLGHFTCNSLGERVCLSGYIDLSTNCVTCAGNFREPDCTTCEDNFQGPSCDTCVPDYYPPGICTTFCQSRNDSLGHFTCNSLGERVCLARYIDLSSNCVTCAGNFREPDCTTCDDNFQGPNCDTCAPDYYPAGICNTFCQPRNDSLGHYTCDSFGRRVCLPGYTDSDTNCVTCTGNFREPDCVECDQNFQGPTCEICIPMYTDPSTGCRMCAENFREPDCTTCEDNFQGPNCDRCELNYYPQGICNVFCLPLDDSTGHFTCDDVTGEMLCLPGFQDPSTNCVTAVSSGTAYSYLPFQFYCH